MIITLSKTTYYELKADYSKNRMYICILGFWREKGSYLADLDAACKTMSRGFSIQVDLAEMKAPRNEIGQVHEEAQVILMKYGLAHTAEIQSGNAITKMVLRKYSDNSGMGKQVFLSHSDAAQWLDSFL
ncbi:MAG: hypothetical protein ACI8QD_000913 [Cyclobacteriaceae bacterium]|jgi:hypothetical protein